jgi:uncharacterized protein (DUF2147 family)
MRVVAMRRFLALGFAALVVTALAGGQSSAAALDPTPTGVWLHANQRFQIEIAACGVDLLCAKIVWFRAPNDAQGMPRVDVKNADPALRSRPLLGLTVLRGLHRTGDNSWVDGKVYNPDDGTDYQATMSLGKDGALRIRAYVMLPLLGKTLTWTRIR